MWPEKRKTPETSWAKSTDFRSMTAFRQLLAGNFHPWPLQESWKNALVALSLPRQQPISSSRFPHMASSQAPSLSRRDIRVKVFQALFNVWLSDEAPEVVYDRLLASPYKDLLRRRKRTDDAPLTPDHQFLRELFEASLRVATTHEADVRQALQNWQLERIALADRVLIFQGLAEMFSFPDIPIKVTINECIDIAKEYSTDQSGSFVNGVLDRLQHELKERGDIQKQGPGLLDYSPGKES